MAQREHTNQAQECPKTGRPLKDRTYRGIRWVLPLTGLASLIWFLIRVIPKPTRAAYPCQRMAVPLASGFIVWGLSGSSVPHWPTARRGSY
jgi:hypothetical protein